MGFMSEYKHLDAICRDLNGTGISGYIEDMEHCPDGYYRILNWGNDYKQLKHYRWVRNQIAHEAYAEEENMCRPGDEEWLEDFHRRIMSQKDPLALYYRRRKADFAEFKTARGKSDAGYQPAYKYTRSQRHRPSGRGRSLLVRIAVFIFFVVIFLLIEAVGR